MEVLPVESKPSTWAHSKRKWWIIMGFAAIMILLMIAFPFLWRRGVRAYYDQFIYSAEQAPTVRVGVVFGAGVLGNQRLSTVLRDRMDVAIELYHADKVQKLIVSGDNGSLYYDEPTAMLNYALRQGVLADDVHPDYGGRRTYDTCYRARDIFQLDEVILVTQRFHLSRALFLCRGLGVSAYGVEADLRVYRAAEWFETREIAATLRALWDLVRRLPAPVMGEPIAIE